MKPLTTCPVRNTNTNRDMSGITSSINGIDVAGMRKPYMAPHEAFQEDNMTAREPLAQFAAWFKMAMEEESIVEANAMTLATASK